MNFGKSGTPCSHSSDRPLCCASGFTAWHARSGVVCGNFKVPHYPYRVGRSRRLREVRSRLDRENDPGAFKGVHLRNYLVHLIATLEERSISLVDDGPHSVFTDPREPPGTAGRSRQLDDENHSNRHEKRGDGPKHRSTEANAADEQVKLVISLIRHRVWHWSYLTMRQKSQRKEHPDAGQTYRNKGDAIWGAEGRAETTRYADR